MDTESKLNQGLINCVSICMTMTVYGFEHSLVIHHTSSIDLLLIWQYSTHTCLPMCVNRSRTVYVQVSLPTTRGSVSNRPCSPLSLHSREDDPIYWQEVAV